MVSRGVTVRDSEWVGGVMVVVSRGVTVRETVNGLVE